MSEPKLLEVMEELEVNRRNLEKRHRGRHPGWVDDERRANRGHRNQLGTMGPYRYAMFKEMGNKSSRIRAEKHERDAEGMKKAEFFTKKINGLHPFHVEFENASTEAAGAFLRALHSDRQALQVHDLQVSIRNEFFDIHNAIQEHIVYGEWMRPYPLLVWATIPHPIDYQEVEKRPEEFRARLENAHRLLRYWKWLVESEYARGIPLTSFKEAYAIFKVDLSTPPDTAEQVLQFWKWCVDLDLDRGISFTTLKQAKEQFQKEDSKIKTLWMKDTGIAGWNDGKEDKTEECGLLFSDESD